jgi:hypothetical protein
MLMVDAVSGQSLLVVIPIVRYSLPLEPYMISWHHSVFSSWLKSVSPTYAKQGSNADEVHLASAIGA